MQVAHPQKVALASSQILADKMLAWVGTNEGVISCNKFCVDCRLIGPDDKFSTKPGFSTRAISQPATPNREAAGAASTSGRMRRKGLAKQAATQKRKLGSFSTREAWVGKVRKRSGRLCTFKEGRSRMCIAWVLPTAIYGADREP